MLLSFTPDQELLFDQDPAHWTNEGSEGWIRHMSGARIQLCRLASRPGQPNFYALYTAGQDRIALLDDPLQDDVPMTLPGLMHRLQATFSAEHRAGMQEVVDHFAFLLMEHGCSGSYRAILNSEDSYPPALSVIDDDYKEISISWPGSLMQAFQRLRWTRARWSLCYLDLCAHPAPRVPISLPPSAHAQLALRARLRATYAWARPEAA